MIQRYAPDTNFFLQFKKPQELPWQEITDADTIELVVLNEVLDELDNHKNGGNERRARRARDTQRDLRPLMTGTQDEVVVREKDPRVLYRLAPLLPANRTKPTQLDMGKADARIVEEALACTGAGDAGLTLLTHDAYPLRLAGAVGLARQVLPEEWRLPPESDDKDKKIVQLQQALDAMSANAPRIEVSTWVGERQVERIESRLVRYPPLSPAFIDRAMAAVESKHPPQAKNVQGEVSVFFQRDDDRYEREREEWLASVREALERNPAGMSLWKGVLEIELVLSNQGSVSAEQFDVEVLAEGAVRMINPKIHDYYKDGFGLPKPPVRKTAMDFYGRMDTDLALRGHNMPSYGPIRSPFSRDFQWSYDSDDMAGRMISGNCGDFRHQIHEEQLKLLLAVAWGEEGPPEGCIRICYSAKNLSERVEQVVPVRFEYVMADSEESVRALLRDALGVEI